MTDLRFRLDRLCGSSSRVPVLKVLVIAALLVLNSLANPGYCARNQQPGLQRLFHLVGIPGLRRDERVDLTATADGLQFQTKKVRYEVPFARIRRVLLLQADRRYEGRTYAAAVATYGVGAFFILKKHHVDTAVLDYVNERGGRMGIVLQMEVFQGEELRSLLKSRDVSVDEPEGLSESPPKIRTETDNMKGSKQ